MKRKSLITGFYVYILLFRLSSTQMRLLFSFDHDMRIEKNLIQILVCQLLCTLMQLFFFHLTSRTQGSTNSLTNSRLSTLINSCSRLTRTCEFTKLRYKLSLFNSHQLGCKSSSRLTRALRGLRKPSFDIYQTCELKNLLAIRLLSTLISPFSYQN